MQYLTNENGLTEKQQIFADTYLATGNSHEAVHAAGYDCANQQMVRTIAYQTLRSAKVKAYIEAHKAELRERFRDECYGAFQTIVNIMQSEKVSARTRLDAARDILDRAGYNPTTKIEGGLSFDNRIQEVASRARALAEGALDMELSSTSPGTYVPLDAEIIETTSDTPPLTATTDLTATICDAVVQPDSPPNTI